MADAPELKRGLLGYRRNDVQAVLADRERMFVGVSEEAREAEERLATAGRKLDELRAQLYAARGELEARTSELGSTQARVGQLEAALETATSQLAEHSQRAREAEQRLHAHETSLLERIAALEAELDEARATPVARVGELTAVLDATRDAVERIMAGARRSAEDQLADVQRTREELRSEIERASAWHDHVAPLIDVLRGEIGRAQAQVMQVGARVGEALRPMTEAIATLERGLDDLERAARGSANQNERSADRVDLVSHERDQADASTAEAAQRAVPEGPPAREAGEGWR
jgi:chromosome segregation ATPase